MGDKLEITLRITLDRPGVERHLGRSIENDTAFFVLGLVHAQLTGTFGDDHCFVDMDSATGLDPAFVRSMNSFARRHKKALETLETVGEVTVADKDILEVFQLLHNVIITPVGGRWRVARMDFGEESPPAPKN